MRSATTCKAERGASATNAAMAGTTLAEARRPTAVEYPHSDGRIIAGLPWQGDAILYAMATLRNWFLRHDRV